MTFKNMTFKNIDSILSAGFAMASLVLSLGPTGAAAAGDQHNAVPAKHRIQHAYRVDLAGRLVGLYGYVGAPYAPVTGYEDVPRGAILYEACDLPTSACPNDLRINN